RRTALPSRSSTRSTSAPRPAWGRNRYPWRDPRSDRGERRAPLPHPLPMSQRDVLGLIALDVACLLAAAMMLRAWSRRRTRPPVVAAIFVVVLAIVASVLVVSGVTYTLVVGPTFIVALLVIMYTEIGRAHV